MTEKNKKREQSLQELKEHHAKLVHKPNINAIERDMIPEERRE